VRGWYGTTIRSTLDLFTLVTVEQGSHRIDAEEL